jgi:hypothetical protein
MANKKYNNFTIAASLNTDDLLAISRSPYGSGSFYVVKPVSFVNYVVANLPSSLNVDISGNAATATLADTAALATNATNATNADVAASLSGDIGISQVTGLDSVINSTISNRINVPLGTVGVNASYRIQFLNSAGGTAGTIVSTFVNANTAIRQYTFHNRDGIIADDTDLFLKEDKADKDDSSGYVGLTGYQINFKNSLGTFTSNFTNTNTAARTYVFPDRTGTIADDTDLALKQSLSGKDATSGYAGLTGFNINFKNVAGTFTSFFTNTNTAARTYTLQNRNGTLADDTDLATKQPLDATLTALAGLDSIPGIQYQSGVDTFTKIPNVAAGKLLVSAGGSNAPFYDNSLSGDFTIINSAASTSRTLYIDNSSNTSASHARCSLTTGGTSAGDSFVLASVSGGGNISFGLDNSDAAAFVIAMNTLLGTNNVLRISQAGEMTLPLQPDFLAIKSATSSNVTGDGTNYTIICNTEIRDRGNNYNNATGTFTAPVTGSFDFKWGVSYLDLAAGNTTGSVTIVASNRTARVFNGGIGALRGAVAGQLEISGAVNIDMDVGDTAVLKTSVSGGTLIVDVDGNATDMYTYFGGRLVG